MAERSDDAESINIRVDLRVRPLDDTDYGKDFLPLLAQLTEVGTITEGFFKSHLADLRRSPRQRMIVAEDLSLQRICATGTMVVEPKLVNRPIVCTAKGVKLCRPSETVLDLLERFPPGPFRKEDGSLLIDAVGQRVG